MKVQITSSLVLGIISYLSLCVWDARAEVNVVQSEHPKFRQTYSLFARAERADTDPSPVHSVTPVASKSKLVRRAQRWTPDEEGLLLELRDNQRLSWDEILPSFPGRGWKALQTRYYLLKEDPSTLEEKAIKKKWSLEEREQLLALKRENKSWEEIAEEIPGRSIGALKGQYNKLQRDVSVPKRATSRWTAEEDNYLRQLAEEDLSWEERMDRFNTHFNTRPIPRTLGALRARISDLRPSRPGRKGRFTRAEDDEIIDALKLNMTVEEISELIERSRYMTFERIRMLENSGLIESAPQLAYNRSYTEADLEQIYRLWNEGKSFEDIAIEDFPGRRANGLRQAYRKYRIRKESKGE